MNNCCRRIAAQARDEVAKALNGENPPGAVEYVFDQFSLRVALLTYAKRGNFSKDRWETVEAIDE